jgi:hypothetical protein
MNKLAKFYFYSIISIIFLFLWSTSIDPVLSQVDVSSKSNKDLVDDRIFHSISFVENLLIPPLITNFVIAPFSDNFTGPPYILKDGQISPNGKWIVVYNGFGSSGVKVVNGNNVYFETPKTSTSINESHASQVNTVPEFQNFKLSLDVKTVSQLRQNSKPNSWEVAWVFLRFTDSAHHYYFILKPGGVEFGKHDGSSRDQVFLFSKNTPKVKLGQWSHWDVTLVRNHITVFVDSVKLADLVDPTMSSQLGGAGKVSLYNEDSSVLFDNVQITPINMTSSIELSANTISSSKINLSWTPPVTHGILPMMNYEIFRAFPSGVFRPLVNVTGSTINYNDTGLAPSTRYNYTLYATDSAGDVHASNSVANTTQGNQNESIPEFGPSSYIILLVSLISILAITNSLRRR